MNTIKCKRCGRRIKADQAKLPDGEVIKVYACICGWRKGVFV